MRTASLVHITPKGKPEYWIVTVAGRGELCKVTHDFQRALSYHRQLNRRMN